MTILVLSRTKNCTVFFPLSSLDYQNLVSVLMKKFANKKNADLYILKC